jgi:hypothetical protein
MCCIGKYGIQPIIEFYTADANRIMTNGFANVSIENIGSIDAFLGEFKSPLEQGEIECFGAAELPLTLDIALSWAENTNVLQGKLKVKKYKIIKLCP